METEATTKTPIPIHRESVFYLLSPVFCPTLPSFPDCRRSTNVERALQIGPFLQNKANFKIGKMNISTVITKAYANEQPTTNNEHDSKQTQSAPLGTAEGPSLKIHTPFTLLAQDGMNRDCFAERGLEEANAANREEVPPLNVRCN